MFNYCIWNGKKIEAFEISKLESREREIRKASANKELRCLDPDCEYPAFCYKHGAKRRPYFSHYRNSNCGYTNFIKDSKNALTENVCNALFHHLKNNGYEVEREYRFQVGGKFCHLMLNINNTSIVLQIGNKTIGTREHDELQKACDDNNCVLKWVVIGDPYSKQDEYQNYHLCRYLFNHSTNHDLIIVDEKAETVSQTRFNKDRYLRGDERYYREIKPLEQLAFENGEITINGFYKRADQWFFSKIAENKIQKEKEEQERIKRREEEERRKLETERWRKENEESRYAAAQAIRSKQPNKTSDSFEAKRLSSLKTDSQFKIGVKISHAEYGIGTILEIIETASGKRKAHIKFENEIEGSFMIENLIKSDRVKLIVE